MQKNENRPDFKKTKVGFIPNSWDTPLLRNCCLKISSGITPKGGKSTYLSVGVAFLRSQNVLSEAFSADGMQYISRSQHEKMKSSALKPRDILFNITGASIGRCCMFPSSIGEANVNQHVCIVRLNNGFCPEFFTSVLNSNIAKRQLYENQAGGGREGLNFRNLGDFRIPLPPLPEQEAIVEVLECWDRGIKNLELRIEKKRNIKKGLMQRLLSGKQRLPGFSGKWKKQRFLDLFVIQKGTKLLQIKTAEYLSEGKYPVVDQGQKLIVGYTDSKNVYLEAPVIVFGDHTRIVKWIDFSFVIGADGTQLIKTCDETDLRFGYYIISQLKLPSLGYSRHLKLLRDSTFRIPSLEEQKAIAAVLSAADSEIEAMDRKLAHLKDQKKFLLNNLVTGTIRLPQFRGGRTSNITDGDQT